MEQSPRRWPGAMLLLGLAVILFAVSAKLALIKKYGTDEPYADQWAAEGMYLLRNPLYTPMTLSMVVAPHGEHHPGLMRVWVRGLILANGGQWDCYLELVANLLIYAAFLAVTWRWLSGFVRGFWVVPLALVMAVLFALPCVYENYLWSFQSQFLFLFLCGILHLQGTLAEKSLGRRWWLGQLAGLLGLYSIAAGSMSAGALIFMAVVHLLRGRRNAWVWVTLAVNAALLAWGLWLLPPGTTAGSHWTQLQETVVRVGYLLSWPFAGAAWSLLVQAPALILLVVGWRNRDAAENGNDERCAALGLWVAGMAFAIGYGRGITPQTIGVRYFDVLVLGLFLNALVLFRLVPRWSGWRRWLWCGFAAGWLAWIGAGLWTRNYPRDVGALFKHQHDLAVEEQRLVRDFLETDDPAPLRELDNAFHRFPHYQITLDFLRDQQARPLLPPGLTVDGREGRLSRFARWIAGGWKIGMTAGALCFLAGLWRMSVKPKKADPVWYAT